MSIDIEQYLLPVGRADSLEKKNRVINKTSVTPPVSIIVGTQYACLTCEHKRVLYILQHVGATIRLQKLNMMNNQMTWLHDFAWSMFGSRYLGDMKVDDECIYVKPTHNGSNLPIYIIDLKTFDVTSYSMSNNATYSHGKMEWYDNETLMMQCISGGYALFNTKEKSFKYITSQNSNVDRGDFAYGNNYALSSYRSNYNTIYVHSFIDNTYFTISLETSTISKIYFCKENNLFYIIQTAKMYTWDPSTKTLSPSIVMPWGQPGSLIVEDNVLYMTQSDSNIAYMYDISKNKYWQIILPFKCCDIASSTIKSMYRPVVFKGYWFIPNNTIYQIHYTKNDKYKLGNKYDRTLFLFDESQKESFEYDERFIEFKSSHLTIHDGNINKKLVDFGDDTSSIKSISVNKNEYNKFKNLKFIRKNN